jgi:hypothetical protein
MDELLRKMFDKFREEFPAGTPCVEIWRRIQQQFIDGIVARDFARNHNYTFSKRL